jgi:F-type H+-transporting ATPase subunit b
MDEDTEQCFGAALESAPAKGASSVRVRSAFPLPDAQRAAIREAFTRRFPAAFTLEALATGSLLEFKVAPEVISGIELSVNGQQLTWSLEGYLEAQQEAVAALFKDRVTPDAAS